MKLGAAEAKRLARPFRREALDYPEEVFHRLGRMLTEQANLKPAGGLSTDRELHEDSVSHLGLGQDATGEDAGEQQEKWHVRTASRPHGRAEPSGSQLRA